MNDKRDYKGEVQAIAFVLLLVLIGLPVSVSVACAIVVQMLHKTGIIN